MSRDTCGQLVAGSKTIPLASESAGLGGLVMGGFGREFESIELAWQCYENWFGSIPRGSGGVEKWVGVDDGGSVGDCGCCV